VGVALSLQVTTPAPRHPARAAHWQAARPGKPSSHVSELGAGAIPGWHGPGERLLDGDVRAIRVVGAGRAQLVADGNWSGIALWQLMDQRTYNRARLGEEEARRHE